VRDNWQVHTMMWKFASPISKQPVQRLRQQQSQQQRPT
jgi:hypothetical protein